MKRINKLCIILLACIAISSCTKEFDEINTDSKNLTKDQITTAEIGLVGRTALFGAVHMGQDFRGSFQLGHSLFTDVYANYFGTTAANFDSDQFILVGRWLNGAYSQQYGKVAPALKFTLDFTEENGMEVENAMFKVWKVFFYHRITDLWGPVPYSNFGDIEQSPLLFDSQEDIYTDFFKLLDEANAVFNANSGSTQFFLDNTQDVVFNGNVDQWNTFANSLRLRLAMRIKYVNPGLSKSQAEKAVNDGVILSNDNSALITSNDAQQFRNNYTTITQWGEFRMSGDMESILKGYQDPRVASYFAEAAQPDPSDDPDDLVFNYEGLQNGQLKSSKQSPDFNQKNSDMAAVYTKAESVGPQYPILKASEVFYLRAEGALEGWNMGGAAKDLYEQGIMASHQEYGLDGNDLSGNPYITSTNVPGSVSSDINAASSVPVAFDDTESKEYQLEQIITQKWIALFPDSEEAYAERRRTGYPTLLNRVNSLNPNIAVDEIPRRMPYTSVEYDNNRGAVEDAISDPNKLGGPDNGTTKLWWDKKN